MIIQEILKKAREILEKHNIPTPQLDAEVLLCYILQKERIFLHMYPEKEISQEICQKFWDIVEKRKKRMPIQYIINTQQFMGLDFYVNEDVLIPRGDTEVLINEVIEIYNREKENKEVKILDIGTGSGAITISLAKYINMSNLYSIDISNKALEVAKRNATTNEVENKIQFFLGSMFEPLAGKDLERSFDFIVSNPPYIPTNEVVGLEDQVKKFEPKLALDGGEDGLDFYRHIVESAPRFLKEGAWLMFEIGYNQAADLKDIMEKRGFREVLVIKDLSGLDRVVRGKFFR